MLSKLCLAHGGAALTFWDDFHHFSDPIFPFLSFSDFSRRYTRVVNPTLYYWSSGNTFKAPQLGP
jgi:hypothetical protein